MLRPRPLAAGFVWCLSLGLGRAVASLVGAVLWLRCQAAGEGAAGGGEQTGGREDWHGLCRAKDHPSPVLQQRDNLRLRYRSRGWKLPQK